VIFLKFCTHCGKEIHDQAVVCVHCGCAVAPLPSEKQGTSLPVILGILGIVCAWLYALTGHVLSIVGIVMGVKESRETGRQTGLILSIIGEVCSVMSSLIGLAYYL
jgi:hypothetical protein